MPGCKENNRHVWPQDIGILFMEVYFPSQYVSQCELEDYDGASKGKYTVGLGQTSMGFCSDSEDINSLCLTVMTKLMDNAVVDDKKIGYDDIGYLGVGTETLVDKSKSVKSVLMNLFKESGNYDVEGVDNINACYGGTAALFNAVSWIESSSWDERYAVIIAADIAVYPMGPARPTGGAGAIAMLIGPNAPLIFERGLRSTYMSHVYDFYKPKMQSEYPTVDGTLSIQCYLTALDSCYKTYLGKARKNRYGCSLPKSLEDFDYFAFHTPYCKLVQKSFARLVFNDFLSYAQCNQDISQKFPGLDLYREKSLEGTYCDKEVERTFVAFSEKEFEIKTKPSLWLASQVGNMYTPSLYGGLISLLASTSAEQLDGKRIGLFSYGSGLAASLFSIRVDNDKKSLDSQSQLSKIVFAAAEFKHRLNERIKVTPETFAKIMSDREKAYNQAPQTPKADPSTLFPGTWYLTSIDEKYKRHYKRFTLTSADQFRNFDSPMMNIQKEATPLSYTNGHNGEIRNGSCS